MEQKKKKTTNRKKSKNNSRRVNPLSFSRLDRYNLRNILFWRTHTNEHLRAMVCQEYLTWAGETNSLDWVEFFIENGIPVSTWQDWTQEDEMCRETHKHVKEMISLRHHRIVRFPKKHEANPDPFMKTLRLYHPDHRELYEEDQKNKEKESTGNVTVVLGEIESTDLPEAGT